ncbi:transcription factor AIG1-like [Amaranthus tricolor]|uniref:transcription factor AIG1-like n=1 Tax=Amaranthus tricolor TaxID=29722 RepID=UPI00258BC7BB|nr:transcription factor AIG1-like [Amaranthus tricolor]
MESRLIQVENEGIIGFDSFMANDNVESYWEMEEDKQKKEKHKAQTKNSAALRSHCEAERRRRERINGHLAHLRTFLPSSHNVKMDKATLLAEAIAHLKLLKKEATEATKGLLIPTDADEITVEPYNNNILNNCIAFKASICCVYKPELMSEIRHTLKGLKLTITNAEICTLQGRMKNTLILTTCSHEDIIGVEMIQKALYSAMDKISAAEEYFPTIMYANKRRRVSFFESSTSSSS